VKNITGSSTRLGKVGWFKAGDVVRESMVKVHKGCLAFKGMEEFTVEDVQFWLGTLQHGGGLSEKQLKAIRQIIVDEDVDGSDLAHATAKTLGRVLKGHEGVAGTLDLLLAARDGYLAQSSAKDAEDEDGTVSHVLSASDIRDEMEAFGGDRNMAILSAELGGLDFDHFLVLLSMGFLMKVIPPTGKMRNFSTTFNICVDAFLNCDESADGVLHLSDQLEATLRRKNATPVVTVDKLRELDAKGAHADIKGTGFIGFGRFLPGFMQGMDADLDDS
jgi:hypothetical protein